MPASFGINDESNTAFSENFESDSNQASEQAALTSAGGTLAGVDASAAVNGASTDFSALVREESAAAKTPARR